MDPWSPSSEDDEAIAEGLALNLKLQGYRTEVMGDGETARKRIVNGRRRIWCCWTLLSAQAERLVGARTPCARPRTKCRSSFYRAIR